MTDMVQKLSKFVSYDMLSKTQDYPHQKKNTTRKQRMLAVYKGYSKV